MMNNEINRFLAYKENSLSENSYRNYCYDLKQIEKFMESKNITSFPEGVIEFLSDLQTKKVSNSTKKRKTATAQVFSKWLEKECGIAVSLPKFDIPYGEKRKRFNHHEIKKIVDSIERDSLLEMSDKEKTVFFRDRAVMEMMIVFAISVPKITALKLRDFEESKRNINVDELGCFPISSTDTLKILKEYLLVRDSFDPKVGSLFLNKWGNELSTKAVINIFDKYIKKSNMPLDSIPSDLIEGVKQEYFCKGSNFREMIKHEKRGER